MAMLSCLSSKLSSLRKDQRLRTRGNPGFRGRSQRRRSAFRDPGTSGAVNDKNSLARHRMVYAAIAHLMRGEGES